MVIYQDLMGVNGIQWVFSDLPWFFSMAMENGLWKSMIYDELYT